MHHGTQPLHHQNKADALGPQRALTVHSCSHLYKMRMADHPYVERSQSEVLWVSEMFRFGNTYICKMRYLGDRTKASTLDSFIFIYVLCTWPKGNFILLSLDCKASHEVRCGVFHCGVRLALRTCWILEHLGFQIFSQ